MTNPSQSLKPKKLKAPKPKPIPDPDYSAMHQGLRIIHETTLRLIDKAIAHEQSIDRRKQEHHDQVQAFLSNPDNRPKFKETKKGLIYTIAFNDHIYRFGPRDNINSLDDDEPGYFWTDPNDVTTFVTSSTAALLACISHFCNGGRE